MNRRGLVLSLAMMLPIAGCSGALAPRGEGARRIADLWWVMLWLGVVVMAVVVGMLVIALVRRRPGSDGSGQRILAWGLVFSTVMVIPVAAVTVATATGLSGGGTDPIQVRIVGHQFWWDIEYRQPDGEPFRTANELHIPVGRPVEIQLESADVIHSFWIPELHGKIDLVPGRVNSLRIVADEPGTFSGQCAEFCGLAHSQMRLLVVAHSEEDYQAWYDRERAPAEVDVEVASLKQFATSCAPCHTVRGLYDEPIWHGDFGPDLTRIASRRMLAANIMPNTVEGLARWIVDPQGVKPGTKMPDVGLDGDQLNDVLALLAQLD